MQRVSLGPLLPELTNFRSPVHLVLPRRCPELAALLQVLTLLQLLLPERSGNQTFTAAMMSAVALGLNRA